MRMMRRSLSDRPAGPRIAGPLGHGNERPAGKNKPGRRGWAISPELPDPLLDWALRLSNWPATV